MSDSTYPFENASRAHLVAALLAMDPVGFGGVVVRAQPGPPRDHWIDDVKALLSTGQCWRRVPSSISQERLLGGLDFSATLKFGKPHYSNGVLLSSDGGIIELAMAERLEAERAAIVATVLDERVLNGKPCRIAVVAVDEGLDADDCLDPALSDRLAFQLNADDLKVNPARSPLLSVESLRVARSSVAEIAVDDEVLKSLAATSMSLGIASLRGDLLTVHACKALASLRGATAVCDDDAALAAQLVLAHRARCFPMESGEPDVAPEQDSAPEPADDASSDDSSDGANDTRPQNIEDLVLEATRAAIPGNLLSSAADFRRPKDSGRGRGRAGQAKSGKKTGRVVGSVPMHQIPDGRLHLLATLRAALPWQTIRRRDGTRTGKILFTKDDLQVNKLKDRNESTTVFVVDASGSQAAQRLSEVKGAIELLIADCYVRRDQVALIAFRKKSAELLLAPTRALARAKNALAELPAGGGTPLTAGIDQTRLLVETIRRQGRTPQIVFLTDGRANVSRDGTEGHEAATAEALHAAKMFRGCGLRPIVVDTSRRPRPSAREFADAMAAAYVPLPHANAEALNAIVGQLAS